MDGKSYVSLEQRLCLVCGAPFDTGNLLLEKRLRASMKRHTTTGWGLCAKHQRLADEGFVALVECDPQRSGAPAANGNLKPEQAYRTGQLAHLRREVFARLFNVPIGNEQACVFVEPGVIGQLQSMVASAKELSVVEAIGASSFVGGAPFSLLRLRQCLGARGARCFWTLRRTGFLRWHCASLRATCAPLPLCSSGLPGLCGRSSRQGPLRRPCPRLRLRAAPAPSLPPLTAHPRRPQPALMAAKALRGPCGARTAKESAMPRPP